MINRELRRQRKTVASAAPLYPHDLSGKQPQVCNPHTDEEEDAGVTWMGERKHTQKYTHSTGTVTAAVQKSSFGCSMGLTPHCLHQIWHRCSKMCLRPPTRSYCIKVQGDLLVIIQHRIFIITKVQEQDHSNPLADLPPRSSRIINPTTCVSSI